MTTLPVKRTDERKAVLAQEIARAVGTGSRVETQSDFMAVLVKGKRVNHLLHFFVGLFTLGFWWIAWIIIAITGGERRFMVQVDEYGQVLQQKA